MLSLHDLTFKRVYEAYSELKDFLPHSKILLKYAFTFKCSYFSHYTLGNSEQSNTLLPYLHINHALNYYSSPCFPKSNTRITVCEMSNISPLIRYPFLITPKIATWCNESVHNRLLITVNNVKGCKDNHSSL